jgi:serine phosphatase RsbU (regulator of sigma subunit)/anti-sigma regulatory factor (Ser/Thr protein kinase)
VDAAVTAFTASIRRLTGRPRTLGPSRSRRKPLDAASPAAGPVDIAPSDPLLDHLQRVGEVVAIETVPIDSPAVASLKEAGFRLAVPLLSSGELIGVLSLGPRRSEQGYSADDRRFLNALAAHAAPALRVGQLVRQQEAEARTRQRFEHELEVARLVQQNYLPHRLPDLPGWDVAALYRPAREVGGDFYDVIPLPREQMGFVIGDVTDKGVPAALVMAATRGLLRAAAQRLVDPSAVLDQVNEQLCPDMPHNMFVTCLYGVLDPHSGRFRFANAGQNLPYVKTAEGAVEVRARGMPLGLLPGMTYEESTTVLAPGESLVLHSDGIAEAREPAGEMFGLPRLREAVSRYPAGVPMIDALLREVREHAGPGAEQEDDITIVTLTRSEEPEPGGLSTVGSGQTVEFDLPSAEGNERLAMETVSSIVAPLRFSEARQKRLETAVSEATTNAIQHGNRYSPDKPVTVRVLTEPTQVRIQIIDRGAGPLAIPEQPDLAAKLAGRQGPRGWGIFLIHEMVDEAHEFSDRGLHTIELVMRLPEETAPEAEVSRDDSG